MIPLHTGNSGVSVDDVTETPASPPGARSPASPARCPDTAPPSARDADAARPRVITLTLRKHGGVEAAAPFRVQPQQMVRKFSLFRENSAGLFTGRDSFFARL